jgi:hypothetical protein
MLLVDLDGVAAAKGDMGPTLSGKMNKVALTAAATVRAWFRRRNFCMLVAPKIPGEESTT